MTKAERKAYVITGPTSGFGYRTALEVAEHGTVVLVGRDRGRLDEVRETIERAGGHAWRSCAICRISPAYGARPRRSPRSVFRSRAWSITRAPARYAPRRPPGAGTRCSPRITSVRSR